MRSKDVTIGMYVKVHNKTSGGTSLTLVLDTLTITTDAIWKVHSWNSDIKCWRLELCEGNIAWNPVLNFSAKDFEPYIEEGE